MGFVSFIILLIAAGLEVYGDALIRKGFTKGEPFWWIIVGFFVIGLYGVILNLLYHMDETKWDFAKLLGIYVAFFALISVLAGRFCYHETIPLSTWVGIFVIVAGGLIIQTKLFG